MQDPISLKGIIEYQLLGPNGQHKQAGTSINVITAQGKDYYVDQLSDAGGSVAQMFVLGTGAAVTPGTGDTWVDGYFSNNGTVAGTAGQVTISTDAATANALKYVGTFNPGYATQTGDTITEVGITNMVAAADGNGTPNGSTTFFISHGTFDPAFNKGTGDTLIVTYRHLFS